MSKTLQVISAPELIKLANGLLKEHKDYIEGMQVHKVTERFGVLSFQGESFLDEQGLPTAKSTHAFNLYKWLCHQLSKQYELQ